MQRLYFLRHATAELIRPGQVDIDRCLIEKGRKQAIKVANFMLKQGINPQLVLSSPYPRAIQTAAIVSEHGLLAPAKEVSWLALDTPPEQALAALQQSRAQLPEQSLLVGHEPDLSRLISALLGSAAPMLKVRKASLTCLQLTDELSLVQGTEPLAATCSETARWTLQWSVPVKFMP